jgi:hypothetical protein
MVALVAAETILLVLLLLLVAGLLRSHAEILRRLGPPEEGEGVAAGMPAPTEAAPPAEAADLVGTTIEGDAIKVSLGPGAPPTLVAYLTSGCSTCLGFWDGLREGRPAELPEGVRVVVVTKDTTHESPSRLVELKPDDVPVIMSTEAWERQGVPAAPYFVYVEDGAVAGEGSAAAWQQIGSLLRDAMHDVQFRSGRASGSGEERTDRIDQVLQAAGIGPDHPSLYPGGPQRSHDAS